MPFGMRGEKFPGRPCRRKNQDPLIFLPSLVWEENRRQNIQTEREDIFRPEGQRKWHLGVENQHEGPEWAAMGPLRSFELVWKAEAR